MTLDKYISEAVSHGYRRGYGFPKTPDKDLIIDWLEENGFREVYTNHMIIGQFDRIDKLVDIKGEDDRFYFMGRYDEVKMGTHWIEFGNKDTLFLVCTEHDSVGPNARWTPYSQYFYDENGFGHSKKFFDTLEEIADKVDKTFLGK